MESNIAYLRKALEDLRKMSMKEFLVMRDESLAKGISHHYHNNSAYRKLLNEHDIYESNLPTSYEEIDILPVVTKEWLFEIDIMNNHSLSQRVVDRHIRTTGTTGPALEIPQNDADMTRVAAEPAIFGQMFTGTNFDEPDYLISHWYPKGSNDFPEGMDVWSSHYDASLMKRIIGDKAIDESTQTPIPQHWKNIVDSGAVSSISAPAFFIALSSFALKQPDLMSRSKFKRVLASGSSISYDNFMFVKRSLNLEAFHLMYATADAGVIATQINEQGPYHVFADRAHVEIVDDDLNPVKEGEKERY